MQEKKVNPASSRDVIPSPESLRRRDDPLKVHRDTREVTQNQNLMFPPLSEPLNAQTDPLRDVRYGTQRRPLEEALNNNYYTQPAYDVTNRTSVPLTNFQENTYITPCKVTSLKPSRVSRPLSLSPGSSDGESDRSTEEEELIDVVNDSIASRSTDTSGKETDMSISTHSSLSDQSPSGGSTASSSPDQSAAATPESTEVSKTKKRTNYSPNQVQALEKVFHENPYPDPEVMEEMSRDIGIAETKIKVWFQNKRARWRKRVQEDKRMLPYDPRAFPSPFMSPVMSPVASYGFLPGNPLMGSSTSPSQVVPGHMMPFPRPPSSPNSPLANQKQRSPMTSPFQQRPQIPAYFYTYPYGMYPPPYFCG